MRGMKRTAMIMADANPERLRTALVTACAHNALGGSTRLFFQGVAVGLLRGPVNDPDGESQRTAGLPTLGELFDEALGMGVTFACCQSSLILLDAMATDFDARIQWMGMVGFLSTLEPDDRLLVI